MANVGPGLTTMRTAAAVAAAALLVGAADASAQSREPSAIESVIGDRVALNGQTQDAATLEADQIEFDSVNEVVVASGNVEVFYAGRVLRADQITYDQKTDTITAEGEITIVNTDGSVLAADSAEFDSRIRDGLVRGARAVLSDGQTRLAAVEGRRVDGRFTTLSKAVYSPCKTCVDNPTPLWRIRARRVTQDEQERDIIYEDATFDLLGVPVAYLPFFRHADPTVKRRTGFLTPEYNRSSALGHSVKTPYFWEIAPNRDLTITPFVSTRELPVLELEYRAWESYGKYSIGGSYTWSDDDLEEGSRGHFDGNGLFHAPLDFEVGFNALYASDDTYLRRYEFTNVDRAEIDVFARRYRDAGFIDIEATRLQSFREDEFAGSLPLVLPHVRIEQRVDAPIIGGEFGFYTDSLYLRRTEGRDVGRLSGDLFWERNAVSEYGFVFDLHASVRGDLYAVEDDPTLGEGLEGRVLPLAAATASYPLGKVTTSAFHLVEPTAQIVGAPYSSNNDRVPNEDSQDTELDDLNIFSLNRFPGRDRIEDGPRATVGLRYVRTPLNGGPTFEASLGQTYRLRDNDSFSEQSGLRGELSDVVGAWSLTDLPHYAVGHRFRVTDGVNFRRNEVYAQVQPVDWARFEGSYVYVDADPVAGSTEDRSEFRASGELDLGEYWTVYGGLRRDLEEDRFVTADSGLRYSDECLEVDFSVGRRFNSVEDAPASTNFGLTIRLKTLADN